MTPQAPSSGGKLLRTVAIVLFALAAIFNLLGGVGTSCVALNPIRWGANMAKLASAQWLYILLMIGAIVVAVWGIVVTAGLVLLTTPLWATPTHIGPDGANWVNVLRLPLLVGGALLAAAGAGLLRYAGRATRQHRRAPLAAESRS